MRMNELGLAQKERRISKWIRAISETQSDCKLCSLGKCRIRVSQARGKLVRENPSELARMRTIPTIKAIERALSRQSSDSTAQQATELANQRLRRTRAQSCHKEKTKEEGDWKID
ncbi:hypothetical protein A4A49_55684, partial [Nicotiana attenuata]